MANENYWSPEAIQARVDAYRNETSGASQTQVAPQDQTLQNPAVAAYNAQFDTAADQRTYLTPAEIVQVRTQQGVAEDAARSQAMEGNIMDLFTQEQAQSLFDNRNAVQVAKSMGADPTAMNFEGGEITDTQRTVGAFDEPTNVAMARQAAQENLTAGQAGTVAEPTYGNMMPPQSNSILSVLGEMPEEGSQVGQGGKGGGKRAR
jgi:hypothetical protein